MIEGRLKNVKIFPLGEVYLFKEFPPIAKQSRIVDARTLPSKIIGWLKFQITLQRFRGAEHGMPTTVVEPKRVFACK